MGKTKSKYVCQECGHEAQGWLGRCPGCGTWNSLIEEKSSSGSAQSNRGLWFGSDAAAKQNRIVPLAEISLEDKPRLNTGLAELDRVLGGGFVPGSLVLIGGDPGIGKSTLLLQALAAMSRQRKLLYVSGEESPRQIRLRATRLQVDQEPIEVLAATDFSTITETLIAQKPELAVIDSIQTVYVEELTSAPGSVSQIREAAAGLLRLAKTLDIVIVLVGHVTKEGSIAGPRVLEHMVDTVLYFEGDHQLTYRMLRAVKNRFGATDELGLFEMTDKGLLEVSNASMAMLNGRPLHVPGSAITCCIEGTRPMLIEIQALVQATVYGSPQRMTQGLDRNRVTMLLAVLEKHLRLGTGQIDTYVNVVGGLRISEPSVDLAIVAAIVSSFQNKAIRTSCLTFGEVGLTGEIRAVSQPDRRVQEAVRQGFKNFILPGSCRKAMLSLKLHESVNLYYVDRIGEVMDILLDEELSQ
ncbi:MAG: DNA repair protein RadA [Clostridiaceae bacterium]|nr:DNA repair protein RadA [Clostridiaceae bacterium]